MPEPIHPGVPIGHVHLKVDELDRALGFYRDALGFELTERLGRSAALPRPRLPSPSWAEHLGEPQEEGRNSKLVQ
jgi:catechol 2,3-dioxygenase-like lactoylglutathione lyase family enzyme